LRDLALGGLTRAVPRGDVRDLVRHHARQFRLRVGFENQPRVHEEEAARQRERVNVFRIDDLDGEWHLGVGVAHQVLAHPVHIFGNHRIVDNLRLPLDVLRELLAQRDFFIDRVEIDALADVAIADLVGILLFVAGPYWKSDQGKKGASGG